MFGFQVERKKLPLNERRLLRIAAIMIQHPAEIYSLQ